MGALLRQALTLARLHEAFARVSGNHGQAGVDGVDIETFAAELAASLGDLRADVLARRYRPAPLKRLWLPRPGKEPRPIGIPTVRDRVLQTAVAQTITPLLEAEFEECSYAYRQGRSVRMAVERIGALQRQGYGWVVEADIERFFDCIPHPRLLAELRAVVHDEDLVALVGLWLAVSVQDGERLVQPGLGVPQGSPISPLLANLYLDHLDEALLDRGFALVRYADDFIVLAKSRDRAEAAVALSAEVLRDLELKLNPLKTRVVNFDTGFKFLGWNFVRSLAVPASRAGEWADAPAWPRPNAAAQDTPESCSGETGAEGDQPLETEMAAAFAEALAERPDLQIIPDGFADAAPDEQATPAGAAMAHPDDIVDEPVSAQPPPSLQRTLYLVDPAASLSTENRHLQVRRDDARVNLFSGKCG